ncbi:MAG: 4-hydroxy-3-methylbut-2-enyl diphosphate reductase [Coriobacteriia bacterium]|nr:4-hydroxy-3-methylbut-2-enyl diphosphate reductase [Coriobacteriia bacterium]
MQVIRAKNAGACYGVQRAVDLADQCIADGLPATTLGPLIHNPQVVSALMRKGIAVCERVEDIATDIVIIRSHGVVPQVLESIQQRGLSVIDATCPHVSRAQKSAAELAAEGLTVVVVGEEGHPEVEGLKAYALREGQQVVVAGSAQDIPDALPARVGVVVQTTQMKNTLDEVVAAICAKGCTPVVKNTICYATTQRQEAATQVARKADAMVVIGGRNSSNTTRLAEICSKVCSRVYHVESDDPIDPAWFEGCETVGVTAGASTPEDQIADVVAYLEQL